MHRGCGAGPRQRCGQLQVATDLAQVDVASVVLVGVPAGKGGQTAEAKGVGVDVEHQSSAADRAEGRQQVDLVALHQGAAVLGADAVRRVQEHVAAARLDTVAPGTQMPPGVTDLELAAGVVHGHGVDHHAAAGRRMQRALVTFDVGPDLRTGIDRRCNAVDGRGLNRSDRGVDGGQGDRLVEGVLVYIRGGHVALEQQVLVGVDGDVRWDRPLCKVDPDPVVRLQRVRVEVLEAADDLHPRVDRLLAQPAAARRPGVDVGGEVHIVAVVDVWPTGTIAARSADIRPRAVRILGRQGGVRRVVLRGVGQQ